MLIQSQYKSAITFFCTYDFKLPK